MRITGSSRPDIGPLDRPQQCASYLICSEIINLFFLKEGNKYYETKQQNTNKNMLIKIQIGYFQEVGHRVAGLQHAR
jgi:hypothetical protein